MENQEKVIGKIHRLDLTTKIILIGLIILISYFIFFTIFQLLFMSYPRNMMEMMEQMMGRGQRYTILNIISLIIAMIVGFLASLVLKTNPERQLNEFSVLQKALSGDERKVMDELRRAGKITQDSLRFRLDWSKAKVSRILTNLDKMNLIQRERTGKTYIIHLQKRK